jgi:hypothetical protein
MGVESSHECVELWSRGLLRSTARLYEDLLVVIRMFKCSNKEVGVVCARMTSEVGRKVGGELRNANAFVAVNEGWHGELRLKRASPLYCGGKGGSLVKTRDMCKREVRSVTRRDDPTFRCAS